MFTTSDNFFESATALFTSSCDETKEDDTSKDRPYKCDYCGKSYNSKIYLRDHLTIHSNIRAYECLVCNKRFRFGSNLSEHKTVHYENNLFYKCPECDYAVRLRGNLKKHMRMHYRDTPSLEENWRRLCAEGLIYASVNRSMEKQTTKLNRSAPPMLFNPYFSNKQLRADTPQTRVIPRFPNRHTLSAFGLEKGMPRICPPILQKCDGSRPSVNGFNGGPPDLITFGPTGNGNVLMNGANKSLFHDSLGRLASQNQQELLDNKINSIAATIEKYASSAMSVEKFIENVSIISFDDVKCPFCNARFAVREECENHIFISHSKPKDPQSGVTLFCDTCLKTFDYTDAMTIHENYHALVKSMIESDELSVKSSLQAFIDDEQKQLSNAFHINDNNENSGSTLSSVM